RDRITGSEVSPAPPELARRYGLTLSSSSSYQSERRRGDDNELLQQVRAAREDIQVNGNSASYPFYVENGFYTALDHPLSTFSLDVDTASYANVRRFLENRQWPPRDAVRI